MAGSHCLRWRGGCVAAIFAVILLALIRIEQVRAASHLGFDDRGQSCSNDVKQIKMKIPHHAFPRGGEARGKMQTPPCNGPVTRLIEPYNGPAFDIDSLVDEVPQPLTACEQVICTSDNHSPITVPTEATWFDTVSKSIFGKSDPDAWRPLPLSTLFSEGWNEPWVPSPSGSGGAPRQGWINAVAGNNYRLWFFTFSQTFNNPPKSNGYLGAYTVFTPLNRRLDLVTNIPFVIHNNVDSGLPIIGGGSQSRVAEGSKSQTGFGDVTFTPRLMLHETKDFSLTAEVTVAVPTGAQPVAGNTSVFTPGLAFWSNVVGTWVVRGGVAAAIPTNGSSDSLISHVAIGQTLTRHDQLLLGDFTYYLSTVATTPLNNGGQTSVTVTPGIRNHIGNDWYILAGLPTPVTNQRIADFGMIFWLMKTW